MALLLLRHAKAGTRKDFDGDDTLRPLTRPGWIQARALVKPMAELHPKRVLSSPYTRCVQTVEPLVEALSGVKIEQVDELAEGRGGKAVALTRSLADHPDALLCTHGDIVQEVLERLVTDDGMELLAPARWAKGSVWVLHARKGRFVRAEYISPPA